MLKMKVTQSVNAAGIGFVVFEETNPGERDESTITLNCPIEQGEKFRKDSEFYVVFLDAASASSKVLAVEDAFFHEVLDLVDIPRHIGGALVPLWQRLAHSAIAAKLASEGHLTDATSAVVDAMMEAVPVFTKAAVNAIEDLAMAHVQQTNPLLAAAIEEVASLPDGSVSVVQKTAAVVGTHVVDGGLDAVNNQLA